MTENLRMMIDEALTGATATLEEIAEAAGVSYAALYSWRTGARRPSPENLRRLAAALERRGDAMRDLAARLRLEADR